MKGEKIMSKLSYEINNGRTLELVQRQHNGSVLIVKTDASGNHESIPDNEAFIPAGDMVMLINFYQYIKQNDIKHEFINPNGKNHE